MSSLDMEEENRIEVWMYGPGPMGILIADIRFVDIGMQRRGATKPSCSEIGSRNSIHRATLLPRCHAAKSSDSDLVIAQIPGRRSEDGTPIQRLIPKDEAHAMPVIEEVHPLVQAKEDAHLLKDVYSIAQGRNQSGEPPLTVPGVRTITDSKELDLIGRGLPIIRGPEFPDAYFSAIEQLSKGKEVPMPRPHPKFSLSDMERIAREGPRFNDLVLEHAEALDQPDLNSPFQEAAAAQSYRYIPAGVAGDWGYEVEPNWQRLEVMPLLEFFQGLRQRNWTDKRRFDANSTPWRVQLFRCGYSEDPTGWMGLRALVTLSSSGKEASSPLATCQRWVDMPDPGPPAEVEGPSASLLAPGDIGYRSVLAQLYQAYAQRLPKEAKKHLERHGFVPKNTNYYCPGEKLVDVSFHWAEGYTRSPLMNWLLNPQLHSMVEWARNSINSSGITELKEMREQAWFLMGPDLPRIDLNWDPSNAGPLYFLVCLTLGIVVPAMRRAKILDISTLEEDMGAAMEFARSKAEARKEGLTGVEFKDVAGLGPILGEVVEVVEFLKDPRAFSKLGARPPKGILLEGEPGTGKTLLAKALAGEAMVPFYQMSGTEFTEGIVGVGASRVRDLFKRARANAPCIIFVDEIDALGLKRAEGDGSGKVNEEREQTLNQLLTEMDGFTPDTGVVFIGATNRADLLDPALMRPGRFDRKIRMPKPDTEGRYEILKLNLRNKKYDPDIDLMQLARDLPGLVGADLANVVNEAQLHAVRVGRDTLTSRDMYAGVDRFSQGEVRPPLPTKFKVPVLAFASSQVGTAIVAEYLRLENGHIEPVERVSIQPRGMSQSRILFARGSDEDYLIMTRGKLLDRIKVELAAGIAVRVALGEETNFGLPDVKSATYLAYKFVFFYNFSDLGVTNFSRQPYSSDFTVGSSRPRKLISTQAMDSLSDWPTRNEDFRFDPWDPSDITWHRYTDEVRRIMKDCYEEVWTILEERREALLEGVKALSDSKEMLADELFGVLDKFPARTLSEEEKPKLKDMVIFTKGPQDYWPSDSVPWLEDAIRVPHFEEERRRQESQVKA